MSACNPPCDANQTCDGAARCIDKPAPAATHSYAEAVASTPPPEASDDAYRHNGFYLDLGLGLQLTSDQEVDGREFHPGFSYESSIGGTFAGTSAVVVGFQNIFSYSTLGTAGLKVGSVVRFNGLFVSYYPDARAGLHFRGGLGVGATYTGKPGAENAFQYSKNEFGPSVLGGVGYDTFVSDEWSLGVLGRIWFIEEVDTRFDQRDQWLMVGAVASVTYH